MASSSVRGRLRGASEELGRHRGEIAPVELGLALRAIIRAPSMRPSRARIAGQARGCCAGASRRWEHGFVTREIGAIVLEHPDAISRNLRVGRTQVDGVDLALVERFVGEAVVSPTGRAFKP
jgi:hypothetical protein